MSDLGVRVGHRSNESACRFLTQRGSRERELAVMQQLRLHVVNCRIQHWGITHAATRVHRASRQCSCVADCVARTTADACDWVSQRAIALRRCASVERFSSGVE